MRRESGVKPRAGILVLAGVAGVELRGTRNRVHARQLLGELTIAAGVMLTMGRGHDGCRREVDQLRRTRASSNRGAGGRVGADWQVKCCTKPRSWKARPRMGLDEPPQDWLPGARNQVCAAGSCNLCTEVNKPGAAPERKVGGRRQQGLLIETAGRSVPG